MSQNSPSDKVCEIIKSNISYLPNIWSITAGLWRMLETGRRAELSLFLTEIFISMTVSLSGIMIEVSLVNMLPGGWTGLEITKKIKTTTRKKIWNRKLWLFVSIVFQTDSELVLKESNINLDLLRLEIPEFTIYDIRCLVLNLIKRSKTFKGILLYKKENHVK